MRSRIRLRRSRFRRSAFSAIWTAQLRPIPLSLDVVRTCAETIAGAVETVRRLVDEFSTLARFPVAKPKPADINEIIESALSMFNGRLDGIQVHKSLAADLPKVMADSEAIKRAVANLVDNAAEASQDSMVREIEISTALVASRDAVEITVADTGHGVTRELKEKLFLPYFSTKKRGTGLGLAIVSRIVEDHHGSIRVEENQPVGTRFIMELPVVSEAAPARRPPSSMHNILIVDDEAGIRESLAGILADEGYSTSSVESGEACLDLLRKTAIRRGSARYLAARHGRPRNLGEDSRARQSSGSHHDLRPRHHRNRCARHQIGRLRFPGKALSHREDADPGEERDRRQEAAA